MADRVSEPVEGIAVVAAIGGFSLLGHSGNTDITPEINGVEVICCHCVCVWGRGRGGYVDMWVGWC